MGFLDRLVTPLRPLLPFGITMITAIAVIAAAYWLLLGRTEGLRKDQRFFRQLTLIGLGIAGIFVLLFALPIERADRDQLISVVGLLVSALIAYASSSALVNVAAGVALRVMAPFAIGDHITVGGLSGRVVETGLLDIEIQSVNRELIAIPNEFVVKNPTTRTRPSGALISATVSLGYDVHHSLIERLLRDAVAQAGLKDAFVSIMELGDFSVTYRAAGLLAEADSLLTARSKLNSSMLDVLHDDGVEVISPVYGREQPWAVRDVVVPEPIPEGERAPDDGVRAEDVVFDKANRAGELETEKQRLAAGLPRLEERLAGASSEGAEAIEAQIERTRARLEAIKLEVAELDSESSG